jgi:hypothetical protein
MMRLNASHWTAIGSIGTLLAIIVTVFVAERQLTEQRNEVKVQLAEQRDEAKVQHLVEESSRFDQESLLATRRSLAAKRIDKIRKTLRPLDLNNEPEEMWDVLNACDHIGLLTKRGYLDVTDVWNEMGYWLLHIYADAQPLVEANRKKSPAIMASCSWLIDQMRPIEDKDDAGHDNHPTPQDLYDFYDEEAGALPGELVAHRVSK